MVLVIILLIFTLVGNAYSHFQLLIPSDDIITSRKTITLDLSFTHPFEGGPYMNIEKPEDFGVFIRGIKKISLKDHINTIERPLYMSWRKKGKGKAVSYIAKYTFRKPGDHIFYVVPKPYYEPSEGVFIKQIAKVVVNAFGMEKGWDKRLGLEAEIVPLVRPYGFWEGNTFVGRVFINGKPAPFIDVEVEYYNDKGIKAPEDAFVTQVIKTDERGIFVYTIPWSGWWGFSALGDGGTIAYKGKKAPLELDAVIWIRAYPKPEGVR